MLTRGFKPADSNLLTKGLGGVAILLPSSSAPAVLSVPQDVVPEVVRTHHDKTKEKRCGKCRVWKPLDDFGFHGDSHTLDNKQSVCKVCKNARGRERRNLNVRMRLRHHMSTRCLTQLGSLAPEGFTARMDSYLGYSMPELVRGLSERLKQDFPDKRLRDCLNEGWHVDHIYPLSKFDVLVNGEVNWKEFRRCWAINNLRAIPAEDNLKKGAKVEVSDEKPL